MAQVFIAERQGIIAIKLADPVVDDDSLQGSGLDFSNNQATRCFPTSAVISNMVTSSLLITAFNFASQRMFRLLAGF